MLDFRVNTFLEVCRFMNFTRAAEQLHITQPAVSQHIRYLEMLYGTELFYHEGKKISLSPSGKILLQMTTALKNDEALIIEKMHRQNTRPQTLIFGISMTIAEFVIAKPLAQYVKNHQDVEVKMIMGNTAELLEKLRAGAIHFALIEGYFPSEEYESFVYSTEEFIPVCAARHVFLKEPESVRDLLTEALLVREPGSGTRAILEKVLSVRNISLEQFVRLMEIGSVQTIVQMLKEDCGISFLHKSAVEEELCAGILREIKLPDFKMRHDFAFIWNRGSVFSDDYQNICRELQRETFECHCLV